jgi:hypothetical protein
VGLVALETSAQPTGQLPPAPPSPPEGSAGPAPGTPPAAQAAPSESAAPAAPAAPAPQAAPKSPAPAYPPYGYPPYGYPPPGYGQPGYGQSGYPGYPPPYGYPPGYYPYPPRKEREPVRRYPDDAAVRSSPFIEMIVGGQSFSKRFMSFFNVGLQLGAFFASRIRVAGRVQMFPADPDDEYGYSSFDGSLPQGFSPTDSEPPAFLFGGALGVALASTPNFVLAPSVVFLSNDQADDYGSFIGLGIPFDWVTDSGLRVGFEVTIGRAFGGEVQATCLNFGSPPPPGSCEPGSVFAFDREAGAGFYSHFHLGWGFNRPRPGY